MLDFRKTIVVLVVAALGVALAWLTRTPSDQARTVSALEAALPALEAIPVDEVNRIVLTRGGAPLVFEREGGDWTQREPFTHPLDPYSIRRIVQEARQLRVTDSIDPSDLTGSLSMASLSLDPPMGTVRYEWPGGALAIDLGRQGIAGRAYLRVEGDEAIYVASRALHDRALEMDPKEWRDRRLFHQASIESDTIELDDGQLRVRLSRDRKSWTMEEPVRTRVDAVALDELLQSLGRAQSDGFLVDQPRDLASFRLDDPVGAITVVTSRLDETADGSIRRTPLSERLLIGAPIGGSSDRFAMIEGVETVFRLPAQTLALFAVQLADPTGSGMQAADVRAIEIRTSDGVLRFERDTERWIAPGAGRQEVPAGLVNELLAQLTELRAPKVEFLPYPREMERALVVFYGWDLEPKDTVRIARHPDSDEWAIENGDNVLRVLPAGTTIRLSAAGYGLN